MRIVRNLQFQVSADELSALLGVKIQRLANVEWCTDENGKRGISIHVEVDEPLAIAGVERRLKALPRPKLSGGGSDYPALWAVARTPDAGPVPAWVRGVCDFQTWLLEGERWQG